MELLWLKHFHKTPGRARGIMKYLVDAGTTGIQVPSRVLVLVMVPAP